MCSKCEILHFIVLANCSMFVCNYVNMQSALTTAGAHQFLTSILTCLSLEHLPLE